MKALTNFPKVWYDELALANSQRRQNMNEQPAAHRMASNQESPLVYRSRQCVKLNNERIRHGMIFLVWTKMTKHVMAQESHDVE